ncbi:phytase domain protein [Parvularcula bermudensis HTCC2503]|uniref:Phytase domain protein n=1 Tax=Parvularcula bermudensis (strain ATCC BAA-594 / HTCC2503 / KCTC 12087) TaxID=314260 RepID=E0TE92_PARBH|nr:phytase [Parvularcula bermudensis]ADM09467.1 phytase domain protein [Parvularcula bermudensis HTCC2503]
MRFVFSMAAGCALSLLAGCATETMMEDGQRRETDRSVPAIMAKAETSPVVSSDDAADDPAIWINPANPAASLVLGTDKQSGLYAYRLDGGVAAYLPVGRLNNVDVRPLADGAIVVATNRSDETVTVFTVQDEGINEIARIPTIRPEPYGVCLGIAGGAFTAFVTHKTGEVDLYPLLTVEGQATPSPIMPWTIELGEQLEGCVVDEQNSQVFVGREEGGIERFRLTTDGTLSDGEMIDRVGSDNGIVADIEGLSLYAKDDGTGYLVASSQGNDTYAVYDRLTGAYLGRFRIAPGDEVDGAEETDGLDVTSRALPGYPEGMLVVQDGFNDDGNQNFKYVDWRDVRTVLSLD